MITVKRIFLVSTLLLFFPLFGAIAQKARTLPNPKNIIIMIADGVGYNHIIATDYFLGMPAQVQEKFPVRLAMAHCPAKAGEFVQGNPAANYDVSGYNPAIAWRDTAYLKRDVTESAAAATTIATGVKTYNNSVGMSVDYDTLVNLVQWAKSIGKSAGVVTSVEFSHATPAGFVAHNLVRTNYPQIASEMLLDSQCDVIMGCGNPMFDNDGLPKQGKWENAKYVVDSTFWRQIMNGSGKQTEFGINGTMNTVEDVDGDNIPDPWTMIHHLEDFKRLQKGSTPKRVLGCPEIYQTLQQARTFRNGENNDASPYVTPFIQTVPALSEMVAGALNVLDNNPKGFFIMIEGGATDWAAHSNQKGRLIEEMQGFFESVNRVVDWVEKNSSWDETLLIVTGDHETGFLWGEKPFIQLIDNGKGKLPLMNYFSEDHTNSLIPFFAKGAGCELYRGFADERDSVRGSYIQNSEVAQLIHFLWVK